MNDDFSQLLRQFPTSFFPLYRCDWMPSLAKARRRTASAAPVARPAPVFHSNQLNFESSFTLQ